MTPHDDPNLELLERELRTLAQPRPEDERLRLALRRQLDGTSKPQPAARRPRRARFAFGAAASGMAAAVAVAVVALVGTGGSSGPSVADAAIVHGALQAVTPPANEILHTKVVGVQNGVSVAGEAWQETSPPYANRGVKGAPGHQSEFADDGQNTLSYDRTTNTLYEQPDTSRPTFADPMAQIRQELANGQAHPVGTVVIDGAALYKIELKGGLIGYFAQRDYQPRYLDDPQGDGSVVRLRVAAYQYLRMTPANRALVSMTAQHPSARIVRGPDPQFGK